MKKQLYDGIKSLKVKTEKGKSTFKERNVLRIIEKRLKKGQPVFIKDKNGNII